MNYEEKILTYLVEKYRKSKKDSGNNVINRRTQIKPIKLYAKYNANDGDYEKIEEINNVAEELKKKSFITYETEKFGTQIKCIYLVDESIDEIESFLSQTYAYVSKGEKQECILRIIEKYKDASPICKQECERLQVIIGRNKIPDNIDSISDILAALCFIENNEDDLYVREASMKVYGDSKYFEENTLDTVCKLLRKYSCRGVETDQILDEILKEYHIYKEPQKICIKGNVVIVLSGKAVDLSGFTNGVEFETNILPDIESIYIKSKRFMTIENRTAYLRYCEPDVVIFYLGGYANRFQRDFIKLINKYNPEIEYWHFGDIDAGGFWIHHDLCEKTGVKFNLFHMSEKELISDSYKPCLHKLSESDVMRLQALIHMPEYADTVEYMIKYDVKLEQEIISMNLMGIR